MKHNSIHIQDENALLFLASAAKTFLWLTFGEDENQIISANTEVLPKNVFQKGTFCLLPKFVRLTEVEADVFCINVSSNQCLTCATHIMLQTASMVKAQGKIYSLFL